MAELQKMRVALVVLASQENSKLLSRRQRVAGKEIEVMRAQRDVEAGASMDAVTVLDTLHREEANLRRDLAEVEADIAKLEHLMAQVSADIAALCQA